MKRKDGGSEYSDCKHLNISKELRTMPNPLPNLPENYFTIPDMVQQELENEIRRNEAAPFTLKGGNSEFQEKQKIWTEAWENERKNYYKDYDKLKKELNPLWKKNGILVYDLKDVDYNHSAALAQNGLTAFGSDAELSNVQEDWGKPVFVPKKRKNNTKMTKKSKKRNLLSFAEDD